MLNIIPTTKTRRNEPYYYRGWMVHHYIEGEEQYLACNEGLVLRATTREEIERLIDQRQEALE